MKNRQIFVLFFLHYRLNYKLLHQKSIKTSQQFKKFLFFDKYVQALGVLNRLHYIRNIMRIRSAYFKKEYEMSKAQLIGEGNFAQVFRVFDTQLGDSLAIRRVKKSQADMEDIQKQKQINDQLRKVDNQNILKIYDIIDQPEYVWYITEYCSGGSLWDALNQCKDNKMTEKQGLQCILQISKGVQELHNHRITHRDLKPENILLKTKYVPGKPMPLIKLADFGLSTQKIIMETIAGTKQYIAPQQAKFHNYTNAVDVWSLGIIFDEILHGNPYYCGQDNKEVFNKILKMPFKIRDEHLKQSVKDLLISLLKKKPYQRPIIAVIRSNIEKILQQIEAQRQQKQQKISLQKNKKSKSNKSINDSIRTSNSDNRRQMTSPQKQKPLVIQSKRVYEGNTRQSEDQKVKIDKPNFKKEITPINKAKPVQIKQKQIEIPKPEPKQAQRKIFISEIKQKNQRLAKERQSLELNEQEKPTLPTSSTCVKIDSAIKTNRQIPLITDKINLFKTDRRKMIASHMKKQQKHCELLDINSFLQMTAQKKQNLLDFSLKIQKEHSFLPNTHLSGNQFVQKCQKNEDCLREMRSKYSFLNCFNTGEDYEIKLILFSNKISEDRKICENDMKQTREKIKQIFFQQIDAFIDHFIQKAIK